MSTAWKRHNAEYVHPHVARSSGCGQRGSTQARTAWISFPSRRAHGTGGSATESWILNPSGCPLARPFPTHACDWPVRVWPAVPVEVEQLPGLTDHVQAAVGDERPLVVGSCLHEDVAPGVADEAAAEEGQELLAAGSVHGGHEHLVEQGLGPTRGLPRPVCREGRLGRLVADGSGEDNEFRTRKPEGSARLWEPLVPADRQAHPKLGRGDHREPEVPGGEVELFLVPGPVRDVDLAVLPKDLTSRRDEKRRVEEQTLLRPLVNSADQRYVRIPRHLFKGPRNRSGDRFGQLVPGGVHPLREISVGEQLGEHDHARPLGRSLRHQLARSAEVLLPRLHHRHLDETDPNGAHDTALLDGSLHPLGGGSYEAR